MLAHRAIVFLLVTALLAGCSDKPKPADTGADGAAAAAAEATAFVDDPKHTVEAPTWQVGQWWEWQLSFGTQTRPDTFCTIVTGTTGNGYAVATENQDMAKEAAAFSHPLLSPISKGLGMEGWGGAWDLLSFPLTDGKTWTASLPNIAWDVLPADGVQVPMTATYDASLPGYKVMGHVEQGMLLEATYLPATGWFGDLKLYDIDPGQEELEVGFHAKSAGLNYTGPLFHAEAKPLLVLEDGSGLDSPPPEGQPFVQPQPAGSFTMATGTQLYGVLSAESVFGTRAITITDPANQQRQVVSQGDLDGDQQQLFLDEPGVMGTWQVVTSGAGGYSYAYVELYEVTVTSSTM